MRLPTNIRMKDLKESKPFKKIKKITSSNGFVSTVVKTIAIAIFWIIALIPTWIYLIIRWIADPVGFWQEMAIVIICMIVIGWLQVVMAIVATFLSIALIADDSI